MKTICVVGAAGRIGQVQVVAIIAAISLGAKIRLAICSGNEAVRRGCFAGLPRNNLGIPIPDNISMDGVLTFATFDEALASSDVDLVLICSPTSEHARMANKALRAGKRVFVEKPLSLDLSSAKAIAAAARRARAQLFVGQILPWIGPFEFALKVVRDNRHGLLRSAALTRHIHITDSSVQPDVIGRMGGPGKDLTIHDTHFTRCLSRELPSSVTSTNGKTSSGLVLYAQTTLAGRNGGPDFTIDSGAIDEPDLNFRHGYLLRFDGGAELKYELTVKGGEAADTIPLTFTVGGKVSHPAIPASTMLDAFAAQVVHASVCVEQGVEDSGPLSADLAVEALMLCDGIASSIANGGHQVLIP